MCVCVCVCLTAGKCKAAASGRWRRRRSQDTMVKPTAQEPRSSADRGLAPRRRRSERGSLYSSTSLALPRRAARYAGPPRATRAASRRACRSHRQRWRSEEVGAGPRMRSQREKRDSRCCWKGGEQPAVERRAAQARCRRPDRRAGSRGTIPSLCGPITAFTIVHDTIIVARSKCTKQKVSCSHWDPLPDFARRLRPPSADRTLIK